MFSVGILYSAQEFLRFIKDNPKIDLNFSSQLNTFMLSSPKVILEVSQNCEWIQLNTDGYLVVTEKGEKISSESSELLALRAQIGDLIENEVPTWLPLLARGRAEAKQYLPPDVVQCFTEAGLFSNEITDTIISWWDRYSKISRKSSKDNKLEIGRLGEKYSLNYERHRTKHEPIWQGFESNLSGFDILSRIDQSDSTPLRIEVKTSFAYIDNAVLYITKNEWYVAQNSPNYILHLWLLLPKPKMKIVSVCELEKHIPINNGSGLWESTSIPYSAFEWIDK